MITTVMRPFIKHAVPNGGVGICEHNAISEWSSWRDLGHKRLVRSERAIVNWEASETQKHVDQN